MTSSQPPAQGTLRFARFVVRHRRAVASLLLGATLFFVYPSLNTLLRALGVELPGPMVRIGSSARALFPDHPFIHVQDQFAGTFGNSSLVALAVVVEEGTIFTPGTLAKLKRITRSLDGVDYETHGAEREALRLRLEDQGVRSPAEIRKALDRRHPPYPVNHDTVRSLVHPTTRVVERDAEGNITIAPLVPELPGTPGGAEALRRDVRERAPELLGSLVSHDERAALVLASFVTDRLAGAAVHRAVFDHVQGIVAREEDANHRIHATGTPIVTGWALAHAWEIAASMLGSVVLVFVLLWIYFRRWHGVLIPAIAATATVVWGVGFVGWVGISLDPLVLVIPMIITARAVSHTVQMAERFFEDYARLAPQLGDRGRARVEAATLAMAELVVPGTLGVLTDAAGLLVILVTSIPQMRDLGVFGAFWVLAIIFTVELLHPLLICALPPPREVEHRTPRIVERSMDAVARLVTNRRGRRAVAAATVAVFVSAAVVTFTRSRIGDTHPGVPLFWPDHPVNVATGVIGARFGGVDTLVVYGAGDRDDSVTEHPFLLKLEELERASLREGASGSVSMVQLMRNANQFRVHGDPKFAFVPQSSRQLAFLIRLNSPPGALNALLSPNGRATATTIRYPDHRGETVERAVAVAERFIAENPIGEISVRLVRRRAPEDAPLFDRERLVDFLYYMVGPLLPPRAHSLRVQRRADAGYEDLAVRSGRDGLPEWIEEFRGEALERYEVELDATLPGRPARWPSSLADWEADDVDWWWQSDRHGIRAAAVHTKHLLVQDLRDTEEPVPIYHPSGSWTRGAHLLLAGGVIGTLAAVNREVERGHLANISLILLVIFVLHSFTYRSVPSGAIILLQLATATLVALAYMALRGVGLNIHTLPVQAVGVGIGVDYAIYIVDRIRQEAARSGDVDAAIRRAVCTTGVAVTFTATTVVGGIFFWIFSGLRFQAEMAQLLAVLMVVNMLGAITVVPALYSLARPRIVTSRAAARALEGPDRAAP